MNRVIKKLKIDEIHRHGIRGQNIGIAVIDTGINLHPDFSILQKNPVVFFDFLNKKNRPYDDNGHGTHICGILAGTGYASDGKLCGMAPKSGLIVLKVLNAKGNGNIRDVLPALDWILKNHRRYNIRILNISVGCSGRKNFDESCELVKKVEELWHEGIVVVAAAGNNGPKPQSIGAPANSRKIITVGASDDDFCVVTEQGMMQNYSGRGPTRECIRKPDIVAPGTGIKSCNYQFKYHQPSTMYTVKSGTSMSAPIVSGAIALLLCKASYLTPVEVKMILKDSADDLGYPPNRQGWGQINVKRMLELV